MKLRGYQSKAVLSVRAAFLAGKRAVVMAMPTGAGKSVVFAEIIRMSVEKGSRVLWLVHRRNLVLQMQGTLDEFGIKSGVIMAGMESDTGEQVQIGTVQTYSRRLNLYPLESNRFFIDADLLMIDEGHRSLSKSYLDIIKLYKSKRIVACTATPMRGDGRGMGEVFESIVDIVGVKELTDAGFLAPAKYYVPSTPDLAKIRIVRGDYDIKELGRRANVPKLVGDVVLNWLRLAQGRSTIVFGVNVKHSIALRDEFRKQGITAEHLDARSTDDERDFVFGEVERGVVNVVCNVGLYQEGLDVPGVSCVVMARSTKSMGLYRQCCGRGLRPKNGGDCIIIDHGGVIEEHGYLDDPVEWTLDGDKRAWRKPMRVLKEKRPVKCRVCHFVFDGSSVCPECGSPVKKFGKKVETVDAELVEAKKSKATMAEKRRFFGMLKWQCEKKGYKPGWASWKYKEKFGVWPNSLKNTEPIEPDKEFRNWITYLNIKRAKSKKATLTPLRPSAPADGQASLPRSASE